MQYCSLWLYINITKLILKEFSINILILCTSLNALWELKSMPLKWNVAFISLEVCWV
jgi:hypothetical protein